MKPCKLSVANFQLTLAILKPDITRVPFNLAAVRQMILDRDFLVVRSKFIDLTRADAERFYAEHEGKFFYNRLVTYMSSGTCHAHVLAKPDAIADWRSLMGPTKVIKTRFENPETIRGKFGLTDTRNTSHGSDSDENALKEIQFFFPEFDKEVFFDQEVNRWIDAYNNSKFLSVTKPRIKRPKLELDTSAFVHRLPTT